MVLNQIKTQRNRGKGFTLIELLVVITIIGILAGLSVGGVNMARESAKKAEAKTYINQIQVALREFKTEYGDWPSNVIGFTDSNDDIIVGSGDGTDKWGELYRALSGADPEGSENDDNPRRKTFMTLKSDQLSEQSYSGEDLETGADETTVINVVDPWMYPYVVMMDGNFDGKISVPDLSTANTDDTVEIRSEIAVYSFANSPDDARKWIASWK